MAQEYSQVNFRIPSKLKEDIEKAAFANNRSITSELVSRLEDSFTPKTLTPSPEMVKYKEEMEAQTKILLESQRVLLEQNERQAKILAELKDFQAWKNQQKKSS
ncbi:Arc family DNA-binding protein [Acinetobacter schindleri]|uniref:Arc family DNA-binding protein n=1 Tax=Acinetobacter schindleri TaxID=108981 RepID=UPI00241C154B|nr:Arc family DNA-binding protein [Acinetobacter schindleri]